MMRLRVAVALYILAWPLAADEGMWPYNQFPKDKVAVTTEFLDNLRLASVQIHGGSGSFVSPKGLILTNQHLVTTCLGDRVKDGFYGPGEPKCTGLTANVLLNIEDVSAQVKGKLAERNAAIARIVTRIAR